MSGSNSVHRSLIILGIALVYLFLLWLARDWPLGFGTGASHGPSSALLGIEMVAPSHPAPPVEERITVPSQLAAPPVVAKGAASPAASPSAPAAAASAPAPDLPVRVFNLGIPVHRFVYLIDVSGSMFVSEAGRRSRFDVAVEEVRRSVAALPASAAFDVIFFGDRPVLLSPSFLHADAAAKEKAVAFTGRLPDVGGGTNLIDGLAAALRLGPEVIFLLTDGGANEPDWKLLRAVQHLEDTAPVPSRLYAFGLAVPMDPDDAQLLQKLCRQSGGLYQSLDIAGTWR